MQKHKFGKAEQRSLLEVQCGNNSNKVCTWI